MVMSFVSFGEFVPAPFSLAGIVIVLYRCAYAQGVVFVCVYT